MSERTRVLRSAAEPSHDAPRSRAAGEPDSTVSPAAAAIGPRPTASGHIFGQIAVVADAQARLTAMQPDSNQPLYENGFNPMDITHWLVRAIDQSQVEWGEWKRHVDASDAVAALTNLTAPQVAVVRSMYALRQRRSLDEDLFGLGESGFPTDLKSDQRLRLAALLGGTKVSIGHDARQNARDAAATELHELLHGDLDRKSVERIMAMLRQGAEENAALDASYLRLYRVPLKDQLGALGPAHVMRAANLFMGRNAEADRIDVGGKRHRIEEIDSEVAKLREEASGFFGNPAAPMFIAGLQKERKRLVGEIERSLETSVSESRGAAELALSTDPATADQAGEARAAAVDQAGRARAAAVLGGDVEGAATAVGGVDAAIVRSIAVADPVGKAAAELRKTAASGKISAAQVSAAIRGLRTQAEERARLENPGATSEALEKKADAIAADYFDRFRTSYDTLDGRGGTLAALLRETGSDADAAANARLMEGRGRLPDVEEIVLALAGDRKDTETVERILRDKSALDIKILKAFYFAHTGGRSLDYDLFGEAATTAGEEAPELPMLGAPFKPQGKAQGTARLNLEDAMQKPDTMGGIDEAHYLAARAEREYEYTIEHRGATGAWRDTFGNEERDLLDETIAEVRRLERQYVFGGFGNRDFAASAPARRILEQMRLARHTIRGDREAYEKATAELRATFEAVASFALQAALTAVIGPLSQALLAGRLAQGTSLILRVAVKGAQTAAVGTASTIGANLAVYGSDYSLEMLKADIKGGFGSALGPAALDALVAPFARGLVARMGPKVHKQILGLSQSAAGRELLAAGAIFGEEALAVARTAAGMQTGAMAQGQSVDWSVEGLAKEHVLGKVQDAATDSISRGFESGSTPDAVRASAPPSVPAADAAAHLATPGRSGDSSAGDPTVVARRPGATSQAVDPQSEFEAWKLYQKHRADDPQREVALLFNHRVQEWAVVQGDRNSVATNAELLGWRAEDTQAACHSHPVGRGGHTSEAQQLASGRGGDVDVVAADVIKGGGRASNWHAIHVTLPGGKADRTWVVYSAETGSWTVDYPDPAERGGRGSISFDSVDRYHDWFSQRFGFSPDVSGKAGGGTPGLAVPDPFASYAADLADPANKDLKDRLDAANLIKDNKLKKEQLGEVHQALVARVKGVTTEHVKDLGADPAAKQYRPNEAETALRVEKKLGVDLTRYQPPTPVQKGDWVDTKNVVYDGCSPAESPYFDEPSHRRKYEQQLINHLQNGNVDKVVIDTTDLGLTPAQVKTLDSIIADALKAAGKTAADLVRIP